MKMTREEHIHWCKSRALEYVDAEYIYTAWASMISDLGKHKETEGHTAIQLGMMLLITGGLSSQQEMRKFIGDFN